MGGSMNSSMDTGGVVGVGVGVGVGSPLHNMIYTVQIPQLRLKDVFKHCGAGKNVILYSDEELLKAFAELNFKTDPFHPSFEKVFMGWIHHVNELEHVQKICLIQEVRFLEQGSKIYMSRVDSLYQFVQDMAIVVKNSAQGNRQSIETPTRGARPRHSEIAEYIEMDCRIRIENLTDEQIELMTTPRLADEPLEVGVDPPGQVVSQPADEPETPNPDDVNSTDDTDPIITLTFLNQLQNLDINKDDDSASQNRVELPNNSQEIAVLGEITGLKLRKRVFGVLMNPYNGWYGTPKKRRRKDVSLNGNSFNGTSEEPSFAELVDPVDQISSSSPEEDSLITVFVGCEGIEEAQNDSTGISANDKCMPKPISVRKDFVTKILATNTNGLSFGEAFLKLVRQASELSSQISDRPNNQDIIGFARQLQLDLSDNSNSSRINFSKLWKENMSIFLSEIIKKYSVVSRLAFHHEGIKLKLGEASTALLSKVNRQIGRSGSLDSNAVDEDSVEGNNENDNVEALGYEVLRTIAKEEMNTVKFKSANPGFATPLTGLLLASQVSTDSGFVNGSEFDSPYSSASQFSNNPSSTGANRTGLYFECGGAENLPCSQESGIGMDMAEDNGMDWGVRDEEDDSHDVSASCIFNHLEEFHNKKVALRFYCFLTHLSEKNIILKSCADDNIGLNTGDDSNLFKTPKVTREEKKKDMNDRKCQSFDKLSISLTPNGSKKLASAATSESNIATPIIPSYFV